MTVADMEARIWERLEQDPTAPVTPEPDLLHALNQALGTLALLTLCVEKTVTITLSAGVTFYGIRNLVTNYLRPLRLMSAGARLRPVRIADLDALNSGWQASAGAPTRYLSLGINLVGVYKQPPSDVAAQFTYAAAPVALILQTDTPVGVPEEYHESLIKFGLVWIRLREGGLELAKVMPLFAEFIADAAKLGAYVKARSVAAGYDSLPFAMEHFDASRMIKGLLPKGGGDGKPSAG